MKLTYVAGPMRGYPRYNFDAFFAAADRLAELGHTVVNPAAIDLEHGFNPDTDVVDEAFVRAALRRDVQAVASCDAIALLDGWERSAGAKVELRVALDLGLELFDERGVVLDRGDVIVRMADDGEVRVVNAETGGAKGSKLARFDLIPARALWLLAEHFGRGARKYEDRNWERGYDWGLSFAAMQRHAWAFWQGEDVDPETGSPHLAAVAWHAFVLLEFAESCPQFDSRPREAA